MASTSWGHPWFTKAPLSNHSNPCKWCLDWGSEIPWQALGVEHTTLLLTTPCEGWSLSWLVLHVPCSWPNWNDMTHLHTLSSNRQRLHSLWGVHSQRHAAQLTIHVRLYLCSCVECARSATERCHPIIERIPPSGPLVRDNPNLDSTSTGPGTGSLSSLCGRQKPKGVKQSGDETQWSTIRLDNTKTQGRSRPPNANWSSTANTSLSECLLSNSCKTMSVTLPRFEPILSKPCQLQP